MLILMIWFLLGYIGWRLTYYTIECSYGKMQPTSLAEILAMAGFVYCGGVALLFGCMLWLAWEWNCGK